MADPRSRINEPNADDDLDDGIDPELRLRTVRTAASAIEESIRTEQRAEKRKSMRKSRSRFFSRGSKQEKPAQPAPSVPTTTSTIGPHGPRRKIYVNHPPVGHGSGSRWRAESKVCEKQSADDECVDPSLSRCI
jgi:hypothetical protein